MQNDVLPDSAGGREHDGERQDGNGFHNHPQVVHNDVTTVLLLIFADKGWIASGLFCAPVKVSSTHMDQAWLL
jgi:hypothetical protein